MQRNKIYTTKSETETIKLGKKIAFKLKPSDILFLIGELGSGKTTFTKGLCLGLGVKELVTSPSFVIVSEYQGRMKISHIDLYRLNKSDLIHLPLEEYYTKDGVTIIEWADRLPHFFEHRIAGIYIFFKVKKKDEREINIEDFRR